MTRNLLRGTLYTAAMAFPLWALIASFWSATVFAVLLIIGMVAWMAAGWIETT